VFHEVTQGARRADAAIAMAALLYRKQRSAPPIGGHSWSGLGLRSPTSSGAESAFGLRRSPPRGAPHNPPQWWCWPWIWRPNLKVSTNSEINVEISWLWDDGIEVRLGDRMNGYLAETNVRSVADILGWLQEAIAHFYPNSAYTRGLDPGT
jgi:hypothetical protein